MSRVTASALSVFLLCASNVWTQKPADLFEKAPPAVEEALRDRIAKFYQAHVEGRFRQADQYVAEDTKEYYFAANKTKYLSFAIERIIWTDNFTKAKAVMLLEQFVMMPGFADKPIKVPAASNWKLENGDWYWWVDQSQLNVTPFGVMKPGTQAPGGQQAPPSLSLQNAPDLKALTEMVKADKERVSMAMKGESGDRVVIANGMPGPISLSLTMPKVPGLEGTLDRTEVPGGQQAVVSIRYAGGAAKPVMGWVDVQPINKQIPIVVEFK